MGTHYSDELESKNLICCLEFLLQQAVSNRMLKESSILQNAITEISKDVTSKNNIEYSDIINAFKVFTKFCLIEDHDRKKQILNLIESLDMKTLSEYAIN